MHFAVQRDNVHMVEETRQKPVQTIASTQQFKEAPTWQARTFMLYLPGA